MISVLFQGNPFNITVIQVYALTNNVEEAEVKWFYEDLQDLLEQFSSAPSALLVGAQTWITLILNDFLGNEQRPFCHF